MDTDKSDPTELPSKVGYIHCHWVPAEEAIDTGESPELLPDDVFERMVEECGDSLPPADSSAPSPSDHTNPS